MPLFRAFRFPIYITNIILFLYSLLYYNCIALGTFNFDKIYLGSKLCDQYARNFKLFYCATNEMHLKIRQSKNRSCIYKVVSTPKPILKLASMDREQNTTAVLLKLLWWKCVAYWNMKKYSKQAAGKAFGNL